MHPIFLFLLFLPVLAAECPSGYTLDPSISKCFKAFDIPANYFTAQVTCCHDGGNLASVNNAFVNSFIGGLMTTSSYYYIGLNKLNGSEWAWVDGTNVGYTNWALEQSSTKQCSGTMGGVNTWGTLTCDNILPFICMTNTGAGIPTCASQAPIVLSTKQAPTCPPIPAQCPDGWLLFPQTNSCYLTVKSYGVWDDAADYCRQLNSNLVSIHSDAENKFVANISSTGMVLDSYQQVWIGLFQANGQWKWIDGTAYDWPPTWYPGQPINSPNEIFADDYVGNRGHQYAWANAIFTDNLRAFVCKMELP